MSSSIFRAFRHYNYRLWFFGQGVSLIGTWMQSMAQQVLVYRLTGSAAALGVVNLMALIPLIPFSLWGGSLSDRFSKQKIILWAQVAMLAQALVLAIFTWTGIVQIWHVYLLSLLLGVANAIDLPARQAFTVELVEGKEDLTNAIGLNSAMFNGARALGPALAGVIVAVTGEGTAFFLNSLTFLAVIVSLLLMRKLPQPSSLQARTRPLPGHILEGLKFIAKNRNLMVLVSLVAVSAFLSMPYNTLMPALADQVLSFSSGPVIQHICDPQTGWLSCQAPEALPLGMLMAAVGLGAVIGALTVAALPDGARRGKWLTVGNLGFPLLLLGVSFSRSFLLTLALFMGVGVMFVWQNALSNTLIQLCAPDAMRGRIMAVYSMTFQSFMRLGGLQAGFMADWLGVPVALGLGAAVSLFYGVYVAIRYPLVRRM
jgi:MFS family permease